MMGVVHGNCSCHESIFFRESLDFIGIIVSHQEIAFNPATGGKQVFVIDVAIPIEPFPALFPPAV
jgi:hypothetical protein